MRTIETKDNFELRERQISKNNERVLSDDIYDILNITHVVDMFTTEVKNDYEGFETFMFTSSHSLADDCIYNRLVKHYIFKQMKGEVVNPNQINVVGGVIPFLEKYRDMVYSFKTNSSFAFYTLTIDKVCEKFLSIIADICIKKINSDIDRELEIIKKIGFSRVVVFKEDTAALEEVLCVAYRAFRLIDNFALHPKYKQEIYIPTRDKLIETCILYDIDKRVNSQIKVEKILSAGKNITEDVGGCFLQIIGTIIIGFIVISIIQAIIALAG